MLYPAELRGLFQRGKLPLQNSVGKADVSPQRQVGRIIFWD